MGLASSEIWAASGTPLEEVPTIAVTWASPWTGSPLCPQVNSFPQSRLFQIQCCTVAWSEWGWGSHSFGAGVCSKAVLGNLAAARSDISPPCLGGGQCVCVCICHEQSSVFFSVSICPLGPTISQGCLSPPHRTAGLGNPVHALSCSFLSVGVHPCNLPIPLSTPLGGKVQPGFLFFPS